MIRTAFGRTSLLVAAAALLAACGQGNPGVPGTEPVAPGCPQPTRIGVLKADQRPTAVIRCTAVRELIAGEGEWQFAVTSRATDLDLLVRLLRQGSEPQGGGMCPAILVLPTEVTLQIEGERLTVPTATNSCGQTTEPVQQAFSALHWTEVSRTRIAQLRPQAAVDGGCEYGKDVLAIADGQPGQPGQPAGATAAGSGPALTGTGALQVCRYRSVYPDGWTVGSNQVVDGEPQSGGTIDAATAEQVRQALARTSSAAACDRSHSTFAVLRDGPGIVYVELDGCLRVLVDERNWRQGDQALVLLISARSRATST